MVDKSLYVAFWPRLDAALDACGLSGIARAWTPGRNYRDLFGPRIAGVNARWSVNFPAEGVRVEANVARDHEGVSTWLASHLEALQAAFDRPERLHVEDRGTQQGGRVVRLAVYRPGSIEARDAWDDYLGWFGVRLARLQGAVQAVGGGAATQPPSRTPPAIPTDASRVAPAWAPGRRGYQQAFRPAADREHQLQSAIDVAASVLHDDAIHPVIRRRVLRDVTWAVTEVDGKLTTRYRSPKAMAYDGPGTTAISGTITSSRGACL